MLASHFHDSIVAQAMTAPLLILGGIVVAAMGAARLPRITQRLLVGVGVLMAVAGLYRLVEVPALRHNHLCHGHNSDAPTCSKDYNREEHTHWFGGRTAKPR